MGLVVLLLPSFTLPLRCGDTMQASICLDTNVATMPFTGFWTICGYMYRSIVGGAGYGGIDFFGSGKNMIYPNTGCFNHFNQWYIPFPHTFNLPGADFQLPGGLFGVQSDTPSCSDHPRAREVSWFGSKLENGFDVDVSENSGTPKSSILIGISIINHPFWGTPVFGNTQMIS